MALGKVFHGVRSLDGPPSDKKSAMIVAFDEVVVVISVLVNTLEDSREAVNVQLALKGTVVGMAKPATYFLKCERVEI